jgi:5'-methylthioadenosine phosphorylase
VRIGIICGSEIPYLINNSEKLIVKTPYGQATIWVSDLMGHEIFFINRHGKDSTIPFHKINHRAHIQALVYGRVECILSVDFVRSLNENIYPGDIVLPHDFVDFTKSNAVTFFDEGKNQIKTNMANPFCISLRRLFLSSCVKLQDFKFHEEGVYLATDGLRNETYTEARFYSKLADVVGTVSVPEAILAREKNICYASLCVVYNAAENIQDKITGKEAQMIYDLREPIFSKILKLAVDNIHARRECSCRDVDCEVRTPERTL